MLSISGNWTKAYTKSGNALLAALLAAVLSGCAESGPSGGHAGHSAADISMEPIQVELKVPEEVRKGERILLEAEVTQDGEPVEDAGKVVFEIVNEEKTGPKTEIEGGHSKSGIYTAEVILETPGVYSVTSHVTARTQHSMPTKEMTVLP